MGEIYLTGLFLFVLFLLLGTGVWVGLALLGVAWFGMELFTSRPAGDAMITTIWRMSSSWSLTALPLFIWMGEILFRTRLSEDMFKTIVVQGSNSTVKTAAAELTAPAATAVGAASPPAASNAAPRSAGAP